MNDKESADAIIKSLIAVARLSHSLKESIEFDASRKPNDELAQIIAEKIYNRLSSLPEDKWIHGKSFLPANVLCDYQGQRGLINYIAQEVKETLNRSALTSEKKGGGE